ncbi:FAD-dependent monooxygenase [Rickettsia endosymbiont of Halotydeus destructor]|uniref:FAD-dependent monooxygenase n=1 Tax=Rickettsia endosymbiont of Halotydeus destructor TaxID=2996754 RepID=UPI003BB04B85
MVVDIAHVIILGSGLSGMLTALSMAKIGIKTTIIESKSLTANNFYSDIRTTAITPYSQNFLNNLEIWSELENLAAEMQDVYVIDNKALEILHLRNKLRCHSRVGGNPEKASGHPEFISGSIKNKMLKQVQHDELDSCLRGNDINELSAPLGYVVKNSEFKKILVTKIKENSLINLIDECEYKKVESKPAHSVMTLDNNKQIICDLLIVCDGYHSKVRSYYFSDEIAESYQTALTFDIKHEIKHDNCAMEHFLPLGPFALLPLKNQNSSSVIWSTSARQASLLQNLSAEEFEYLVQRNCGKSLGKITIDSEISAFPLKARLASRYFHNRIVLIADSAHIIHPLAGQGLNQGIKDIETLTQLINVEGIKAEILQQYQKLRQNDNFIMYKITDELNNIFSNYSKNLWYLRRLGFKAIDNLKPIKNLITKYAMGER